MDDYFSNIHVVDARYERAKDSSWAEFHAPEMPINEVKSTEEPGPALNVVDHIFRADS